MAEPVRPATEQPATAPSAGGSAAGRAYREELARQGRLPDPLSAATPPTSVPATTAASATARAATVDARAAERKKVNGRARVVLPSGETAAGKMVDMSLTGACVMLEYMLPSRVACVLEFDIFHGGQRHAFSIPAVSVYGVMSSGLGFKVGFQFGAGSRAASKSIAELVA